MYSNSMPWGTQLRIIINKSINTGITINSLRQEFSVPAIDDFYNRLPNYIQLSINRNVIPDSILHLLFCELRLESEQHFPSSSLNHGQF